MEDIQDLEKRISHLENFLKKRFWYRKFKTIEELGEAHQLQIESTPSIDDLNISSRTRNALKKVRLNRVGEILEREKADLMKLRNFGQKSMDELIDSLKEKGFEW
tara:strand:- start:116 stop:430 length:315 start_codon:yes stop_codon:yes gene_type:complete